MNFLAHACLSFHTPDLIVGNLIADLVKGKQIENFPDGIQKGIRLHRMIDAYTDSHPITLQAKHLFDESAGRYGSSFLDVAYDHFLALDASNEPDEGWNSFASYCYAQIEKRGSILPPKFCSMYMYMRKENWLANYGKKWMIERSFERLCMRANYLEDNTPVFEDFERHYESIKESYSLFFPDLKKYTLGIIDSIQ